MRIEWGNVYKGVLPTGKGYKIEGGMVKKKKYFIMEFNAIYPLTSFYNIIPKIPS